MKQIVFFIFLIGVLGIGYIFSGHLFINDERKEEQILDETKSTKESMKNTDNTFNTKIQAPELTGITKWFNTNNPMSLTQLRGKVVMVDFWTNQCINCIHTLPYVTKWYDTYKDQGFVVIGVHTPELAYERTNESIQKAIEQYGIHYPVAQDNEYKTWNAYSNQYWPAIYLIDKKGMIRRTHFGEGEYEETEEAIKTLLEEQAI